VAREQGADAQVFFGERACLERAAKLVKLLETVAPGLGSQRGRSSLVVGALRSTATESGTTWMLVPLTRPADLAATLLEDDFGRP
jgi:hypothetical protein